MTDTLRVRTYNVLFGDGFLVSIPDKRKLRHILIDVGNVQTGRGGRAEALGPVIEDILEELEGQPVDLYVMTHEHMDHAKGLLYASDHLGLNIRARHVWLTASAAPDYYEHHEEAKKKKRIALMALEAAQVALAGAPQQTLQTLLLNNDYQATAKCVEHIRHIAPKNRTHYVSRGMPVKSMHPFTEARLTVWAPEEDTAEYYGAFHPSVFMLSTDISAPAVFDRVTPLPPHGVDAGDFYNLVDWRSRGHIDNVFAIDRAANNTSIVFSIEWRGWKLLFTGDAEMRSWKTMDKYNMLTPVHLLKVAHHGSINGTPDADLLEKVLPESRSSLSPRTAPDGRRRVAMVSTCREIYPGVPDNKTLQTLAERCELYSVLDFEQHQKYVDVFFEG